MPVRKMNVFLCMTAWLLSLACAPGADNKLLLAHKGKSSFSIVLPAQATQAEKRAANLLQHYLEKISGAQLPLVQEPAFTGSHAIYIGRCQSSAGQLPAVIQGDGYFIGSDPQHLYIGGSGKGVVYGVYGLLETYLGCAKYSEAPAIVPSLATVTVPAGLHNLQQPALVYRESYYPASADAEYLDWHGLQRFEDLWGLWGHSFNKLVPASEYFTSHPEYFALVNGKRQASQPCLSEEAVFNIAVANLKKLFAANPDARYWSVSINDDQGYCTCDRCRKTDAEEGGPQGSVIRFVNRIAAAFPDKQFTTLAYLYTSHAPAKTKPAANVYIMLSTIDAFRNQPLSQAASAAGFRNNLKRWAALTGNIFIWDYTVQFTHYLTPFPDLLQLQPNIQFFLDNKVKGIFEQGSGETYSDLAELNSYLQAKLLWNSQLDVNRTITQFCNAYYGAAGKWIDAYIQLMQENMHKASRPLDIYGNPCNDYNSYLSPANIDQCSALLDKAEAAAETDTVLLNRVKNVRLGLDYVVLQQSRFFGADKFGYVENTGGSYVIKPSWPLKVQRFVAQCKKAGVTELSEGGITPDAYQQEWNELFARGWTPNLAANATVTLAHPFAEDYPAKRERTLVDAVRGQRDFSYNWLCFYGTDMIATLDLGHEQVCKSIGMGFLEDPRHWIFLPQTVKVEWSANGQQYQTLGTENNTAALAEESYKVNMHPVQFSFQPVKARYIRVTAGNWPALPAWRFRENKKPMIACDEILVQ